LPYWPHIFDPRCASQVYNNSGSAITPTLTVNHAGSQDIWSSPTADVSAASLQVCANGAWTRVAYSFSASASSYNGLEIIFDFGNNFGSSSKSIQITECDIRATPGVPTGLNSNPPPPELRPVAAEFPFCQRYFRTSYLNTAPGTSGSVAGEVVAIQTTSTTANNTFYIATTVRWDAPMRVNPAVTIYSWAGGLSGQVTNGSGADLGASSALIANGSSAYTISGIYNGSGGTVTTAGSVYFHYTASAEL